MTKPKKLDYEVVQDRNSAEEWRVEAIDYENDGQVYVAIFSGPSAKTRAEEYARFAETQPPKWEPCPGKHRQACVKGIEYAGPLERLVE